jgi:hypothetical protein
MYQRDLNNAFAVVMDREYRMPIGTIAEAALLAQQLPLEEAPGAGGTTTASATRATRPCAATMNKKYNNLLATSVVQGIKAKLHSRPAFTTLPQST